MKNTTRCLTLVTFILMTAALARAAAPDLIVSSATNNTASVAPGGTVTVASTVKNIGDAAAGRSSTRFYLSKDAVKGAGDVRLTGSLEVPALGRGRATTATTALKVPTTLATGTYFLVAAADDRKQVSESREWNNTRTTPTKVKVRTPFAEEFALIPEGPFQMGDQSSPRVGYPDELPVHTVKVSAFYMGKYEVTKELWDEVRAWGIHNGYTDLTKGNEVYASKGANHPVHTLNWYDVIKWCNARSQKEGLTPCYKVAGLIYKQGDSDAVTCTWTADGYRLPTEAEWEKAARGGASGKNFPWGTDTISHSQANYRSYTYYDYDVSPTRGFHPTYGLGRLPYSCPVNAIKPNGYGLYHMAGNMMEWCWNWQDDYVAGSQTDPRGARSGVSRVIRGGGWYGDAFNARCAIRVFDWPGNDNIEYGFRLARNRP
jgi:formylglycine-generating enzyme